MIVGVVTGAVWATRKSALLGGRTLLRVQTSQGEVVAVDPIGAGEGERVLLLRGSAAKQECQCPTDAAVVAILDKL
ncbi:MAG: carbon dioxide concentrating mechanism protein CcmL [Oscillospiraceae bacterium]|nr:carbon dioxide concentrating mechanism protein CcmL [Oscillospiraceae bacterium]